MDLNFGDIIWYLFIGGMIYMMFRKGGCCGGHHHKKKTEPVEIETNQNDQQQ